MSTKGRVGGITEKKGRSPSLPIGQRKSSPTPSVLDRKKGSTLIESKKVSISNPKKQPSDNIKTPRSLPLSKVTSTRSKPNEKNVTRPPTKITGSTKPKDVVKSRPPLRPKNVLNVKENTNAIIKKQITKKGLENNVMVSEQNRKISDSPPPFEMDHKIVTHEDRNKTIAVFDDILMSDCDKKLLEDVNDEILNNNIVEIETPPLRDPIDLSGNQDIPESETCSRDNVTIDGSIDQEPTNDHDDEINVQPNKTSEFASNRLLVPDHPKVVDQENEGLEIERVAQDSFIGSKYVEQIKSNDQDHEETTQKEPENQKTDPEEPEHGETDLKGPEPEENEQKEPQDLETQIPNEPEHQETQVPEEPKHQEIELPEEPENKEIEVQEELDQEETRVPEEPDHEETEPKELETEEQEEPKHQETEEQEEPEHQETKEPEELKHQEIKRKETKNEAKETEMKEGGAKEERFGSKIMVKKQEVVAYGKKETGKAYNDVIEETVSKLQRQRNNRVKALVGAFETVISLESDE